MMRLVILSFIFLLTACAQLMKGEVQSVVVKDYKQKIYFTSCSGSVETWADCNRKGYETCSKGYAVLEKAESAVGARREITFQCK